MTHLGAPFTTLVTVGDPDRNCMLSSLTPRLVRSEIEKKLKVPSGTLDAPTYKALVKRTIEDAMVRASFIACPDASTHNHNTRRSHPAMRTAPQSKRG
jgi:hypothetical protein